jgi:hypothetical protein
VENFQMNNEEAMLHYMQQSRMPSWISDLAHNVFESDSLIKKKIESIQNAPDTVVTYN